jgi:prevent-host-death family protein
MDRIIGVTDLQRNFRVVFDEVARKRTPYILTRGSRPEVAMIPYDQYLRFAGLAESGVLTRFDRAVARLAEANANYGDDEIAADLAEATKTVRGRK